MLCVTTESTSEGFELRVASALDVGGAPRFALLEGVGSDTVPTLRSSRPALLLFGALSSVPVLSRLRVTVYACLGRYACALRVEEGRRPRVVVGLSAGRGRLDFGRSLFGTVVSDSVRRELFNELINLVY